MSSVFNNFWPVILMSRFYLFSSLTYPKKYRNFYNMYNFAGCWINLKYCGLSYLDKTVYVLGIGVGLLLLVFKITRNSSLSFEESEVLNNYSGNLIMSAVCMAIIIRVSIFALHKRIWMILPKINQVDIELSKLGLKIDFRKTSFLYNVFAVINFISFHIVLIHTYLTVAQVRTNPIITTLSYYEINSTFQMVLFIFTNYALLTFNRFHAINNIIRNSFQSKHSQNKQRLLFILEKLSEQHNALIKIVEDNINFAFAIPILFILTSQFLFLILSLFMFYRSFMNQVHTEQLFAMNYLAWFVFYTPLVVSVIAATSFSSKESKYTQVTLFKAACSTNDIDLIIKIRTFLEQIQIRNGLFNCALFEIDWTWIYAVMGATATYLIILVQFDT